MTLNQRKSFLTLMSIMFLAAGLIWLILSLADMRRGGSFGWSGLAAFIVVLASLVVVLSRGSRSQ